MSSTDKTTEPDPQTVAKEPDPDACVHCRTLLAADQEWCVECGAARTLIHRPPDWRVPVAVIGSVVAVALAALAVALINLTDSSNTSVVTRTVLARAPRTPSSAARGRTASTAPTRTAPARTAPTRTTSTPTTPTTAIAATPPGISSWPAGLNEWTVVLARYTDQATANATALRVKAEGLPAGVLSSSAYLSLKPGGWLVFTGRYSDHTLAAAAAARLRALGHTARARRVGSTPGQ